MDQLDPFPEDFCLLPYHTGRKSPIYLVLGSEAGIKGYLQSA